MKVLVLFLFTENPTLPYKTRGKLSFLFLKKKKRETVKQDNNKKRYLQLKIKKRNKQRHSSFENEGTRPVFIYGKSNLAI